MDYLLKNQSDIAKMSFINLPGTNTDIYGPSGFVDAGLGFQDKRNRNPNWTDHEINRFLEMLQEDDTVKDLVANRNKKVCISISIYSFCYKRNHFIMKILHSLSFYYHFKGFLYDCSKNVF